MIITKKQLQRIIKEELQIVLEKCRKAKSGEASLYMAIKPGKAIKFVHGKEEKTFKKGTDPNTGEPILTKKVVKTAKPAGKGEVGIWVAQSAKGKLAVCGTSKNDQQQAKNWAACQSTVVCDITGRQGRLGDTRATPYEKPDNFFLQLKPLLDQTLASIKNKPGDATEIINVFKNSLYGTLGTKSFKKYLQETFKNSKLKQLIREELQILLEARPDRSAMVDRYAASELAFQGQIDNKLDQQIDIITRAAGSEEDGTIKNAYNELIKALKAFKDDLTATGLAAAKQQLKGIKFKE